MYSALSILTYELLKTAIEILFDHNFKIQRIILD